MKIYWKEKQIGRIKKTRDEDTRMKQQRRVEKYEAEEMEGKRRRKERR